MMKLQKSVYWPREPIYVLYRVVVRFRRLEVVLEGTDLNLDYITQLAPKIQGD